MKYAVIVRHAVQGGGRGVEAPPPKSVAHEALGEDTIMKSELQTVISQLANLYDTAMARSASAAGEDAELHEQVALSIEDAINSLTEAVISCLHPTQGDER